MKRATAKFPKFKAQLRHALIAIAPELERSRRFQQTGFKPDSGKHLSGAIYEKFGIELHHATVQRWINGQGYPSENSWSLLTGLVGESREWLKGEEQQLGRRLNRSEAAEPGRRYGDMSPSERLLELLDEAQRIVRSGL